MIHKLHKTKVTEVDEKGQMGRVVIGVNAFGNEDSDGDISMPGSFTKTLKENFPRVKWYLNHDQSILLGVPIEGFEDEHHLKMIAQFNMNKQISRETYEDYKLYAEYGKTLEHSIGVDAIKRDSGDNRKVLEWKLWEFSTLTKWGANANTPLFDIKEMGAAGIKERIEFLEKALKGKYSDERLKAIEEQIAMLAKAAKGQEMVTCAGCGKVFDYNSQPEMTLEQQVLESARRYGQWIVEDKVYDEMQKLAPEIQAQVEQIIQSKKSAEDFVTYVRCPNCWARVTRAMIKATEPSLDTLHKDESRESTFNLKTIQKISNYLITS